MENQQSNSLQNLDDNKTEILKKRLLKSVNNTITTSISKNNSQQNVLLNPIRPPASSSMIVSSVQASQSSMPITHNLVTHSIAPVKIHTNSAPYPLQLSTVHVPVQIPGSTSNINVPVQLSGPTSSMPLQITPVSLPLQVSGTTSVPVQLPAGETINVPLQIPAGTQNIQLTGTGLPTMPMLQNTSQPLGSIIHVHMGSNARTTNLDGSADMSAPNSAQLQMPDSSGVQMKMTPTSVSQVQISSNPTMMQIPNSTNNSIHLTLPTSGTSGTVQLRGGPRTMPHVVYIQTPAGLKPVANTEVITQASTSGNPPQIIVRRPVTSNSNIHLLSNLNKPHIAPKLTPANKASILTPGNAGQPIVIQKPKPREKVIVPVSVSAGHGKQAIAYLGSVKKAAGKTLSENQSILISNNHNQGSTSNQKLFLTPMNAKMQNTKFILPVSLPATMASKGPIINLQIANGQIQNDPQGNITVMRDTGPMESTDMPPLQPLGKPVTPNNKDNTVPQSPNKDKSFALSIPGSRAEPTGEQGEYTLSIPETNSAMNEDLYTVSIAEDENGQKEKSFNIAIPEKSKSLLNRNVIDKNEPPATVAAPAILRRSNSDNGERKMTSVNLKRRISLCAENLSNKNNIKFAMPPPTTVVKNEVMQQDSDINDDHRVPSLFCDEQLDKELDSKNTLGESDTDEYNKDKNKVDSKQTKNELYMQEFGNFLKTNVSPRSRNNSHESTEEDISGLLWNNGIARLRGSSLHFQTNEFGMIDLIDNAEVAEMLITNPTAKYHTPLKQRIAANRDKKPASPEDLYRCDGCGCHGMAAEFITPNFCSVTCQHEYRIINRKKKEKERMEKRNKIKKLIMSKQISEPDIILTENEKMPPKLYDSLPNESRLSDSSISKINEDLIENEKYPWMCGKNGFSWMRYLDICKAKAAPVKLFKDPFPYYRNGFKVGMRLEAIDPHHPSLFCIVSVAEVQGYRMRLHFDGYSDVHDYWVNADSLDIFPPGWCEKNGRTMKPPPSFTENFSWPMYLKQQHAIAAPKQLFPHLTSNSIKSNGFRIGMKLEAEDRKNDMVCVATIVDMLENRMLINFDSWDEMYDLWVEPASPYIHPVGWAAENNIILTPPNFYKDTESFSWENYLTETGASAAPPRAFKTRPPLGFKAGMKLEVVDRRVPFLIRVATISAVKGHQVRVSFDGWPDAMSFWTEDDSPDLHPVGWCLKTGHPLEPPLTDEEARVIGGCGVGGCRGLGSARGGAHKHHAAASACPYRPATPLPLPDRLANETRISSRNKSIQTSTPTSDAPLKDNKPLRGRPPKHKRIEEVVKTEPVSDEESESSSAVKVKRWRREESQAPTPAPALSVLTKHISELSLPPDPTLWTETEVSALVARVAGPEAGSAALAARLSGTTLVMAARVELARALRLRLGPAVKLHALVQALREQLT